jgi:hypothetical protein
LYLRGAKVILMSAIAAGALTGLSADAATARWTEQQANDWYAKQPWLVGANFIPASAINQLEMWQADTFDPKRIDAELSLASQIDMNTMRVFLHDLAWQQDPEAFKKRLDVFLSLCAKHHIRPMLVLFDSVWDPNPVVGKQRDPKPGVHNSGWIQGPGAKALADASQHERLEKYVKDVVGTFGKDPRVLAWDIWNEPDNMNDSSYGSQEPKNKVDLVLALLPKAFAWARSTDPAQPLTSGIWKGDWSSPEKMTAMDRAQIDLSDVVSFHSYDPPTEFEKRINQLKRYNRPLICTEYMARGNGSSFITNVPIAKTHHVALYNWGLVQGKSQTHLPWDSWQNPYVGTRQPSIWFHDIFTTDGKPYIVDETNYLKRIFH